MAKPTEQEKLTKKTSNVHKGKLRIGKQEIDMDITTETTPNAGGGYDTVVIMPNSLPIKGQANQPGG